MEELLKISVVDGGRRLVSARELHKFNGVRQVLESGLSVCSPLGGARGSKRVRTI